MRKSRGRSRGRGTGYRKAWHGSSGNVHVQVGSKQDLSSSAEVSSSQLTPKTSSPQAPPLGGNKCMNATLLAYKGNWSMCCVCTYVCMYIFRYVYEYMYACLYVWTVLVCVCVCVCGMYKHCVHEGSWIWISKYSAR